MFQKKIILNDAYYLETPKLNDTRGYFQKIFSKNKIDISEQYYSKSNKNVLRGLHFQRPPHDQEKIVTCINGSALDLIIDLRINSKTYLKFATVNLTSKDGITIFIPKGFAHGFLALENDTILLYNTSTSYSQNHDSGILWNSINFEWPIKNPIISERDLTFDKLENFISPF